jgi:hypothetical protein
MHLTLSQQRVRVPLYGAFASGLADGLEQGLALADHMIAVEERRGHALEQGREPFLAFDVGQLADVLAAIDQQVESVKREVGAFLIL